MIPHKNSQQPDSNVGNTEQVASSSDTLIERRRAWSHLIKNKFYHSIVHQVLAQEEHKYLDSKVVDFSNRIPLIHECVNILASAPCLFEAAVTGILVPRMLTDADLQAEYTTLAERARFQPSIYIHLLADKQGAAPTPKQYLVIRDLILDYIDQTQMSQHAWHIDNVMSPAVTKAISDRGYRKYLKSRSLPRSPRRVKTLQDFCLGITNRSMSIPAHQHDMPLEFPPAECGYSKESHTRLAQHRAHRDSNYVMNLVEAICTHLHRSGRFTQHFVMHQYIIYLIFRSEQAAIAEIFCSGLLQTFTQDGGGFNGYPAGLSVGSSRKVTNDEWKVHERWAREKSPLEENVGIQVQQALEYLEALQLKDEDREAEKEYEDSQMTGTS